MHHHPRPCHRRRSVLALGVVLVLIVSAAACGSDDTPAVDEASAATVTMRLIAFEPDVLTVEAGTTVTWVQKDAGAHTVTSGTVEQGGAGVTERPDDRFDSGEITTGKRYQFTFDEAGTYPYFCAIHPATMRGEVHVH